jgi:plasmid stabilization system protein ParE
VEDILATIDQLERLPIMGRHVPERPREDLRELIKPPYRIVYRVGNAIRILTIFRASRLFPSSLE